MIKDGEQIVDGQTRKNNMMALFEDLWRSGQ